MARGNREGENDDDGDGILYHRHYHWSLRDIPKFEGKVNNYL